MACYFLTLLYPAGFTHWSSGMLLSYTSVPCRFQTLVHWHVTSVHFCILQISNTGPVACYFRTLLYPAGFKNWSTGMLFSYTSVPWRIHTLVLWHVTSVHFCTLQVSNTGPLACYFRTLLYPGGFTHWSCGMLFSSTSVSFRFQTLAQLCNISVHCCISLVSAAYSMILLSNSTLSSGICPIVILHHAGPNGRAV